MQLPANFILLLLLGGGYLIAVQPFTGSLWVGIACIVTGVYFSWRKRNDIKAKREQFKKDQENLR